MQTRTAPRFAPPGAEGAGRGARQTSKGHDRNYTCHGLSPAKTTSIHSVEAIRVYFNRGDLADQLRRARRWLDEDHQQPMSDRQVSVRAKPNSTVPRRVVDRLGEDVVREIVAARQAGVPLKDVARRYEVSESSVKRVLRNVPIPT